MMRSYSSPVSPRARARSTVTLGEAVVKRSALEEAAVFDERAEERVEEHEAVGAAKGRFRGALGMRHETEDRARGIHHARDVLQRSVGVGLLGDLAVGAGVAEHD